MKRLVHVVICSLLLSGCATTSHRASSKAARAQRASDLFDQLDINHDGYVSRAEMLAGLRFAGAPDLNPNLVMGLKPEKNKDKVKASRRLTEAEIQKSLNEAFKTRDADLDHRMSKDEFKKLVVERPSDEGDDPWEPFM
jgi:Ca2+-binding EF-hand superfamily protein